MIKPKMRGHVMRLTLTIRRHPAHAACAMEDIAADMLAEHSIYLAQRGGPDPKHQLLVRGVKPTGVQKSERASIAWSTTWPKGRF